MIPSGTKEEFDVAESCEKIIRLILAGANPHRLHLPSQKQWLSAVSYWQNTGNLEMLEALLPPPDANPMQDRRVALASHVPPAVLVRAQEAFDARMPAPHEFFELLMIEVGGNCYSNGAADRVRKENLAKTVGYFSTKKPVLEKLGVVALCGSAQYREALKIIRDRRSANPKVRAAANETLLKIPNGNREKIRS